MKPLRCLACKKRPTLTLGAAIYPTRPDLAEKPFWACLPCGAWVGCHPGTTTPLGRVADAETRAARMAAHQVFDVLWQERARRLAQDPDWRHRPEWQRRVFARTAAYKWLGYKLNISRRDCHMALFGADTCERVVRLCKPYADRLAHSLLNENAALPT